MYEVLKKPKKKEYPQILTNLIKSRFRDQAGIIYCATVR